MKIDLEYALCALDGEPFRTTEMKNVPLEEDGKPKLDERGKPIMISRPVEKDVVPRDLLINAYAQPNPDGDLKERVARGVMAQRFYTAGRYIELTAEDVVKAKELLAAVVTGPVLMMRMMEILDPTELPENMRPGADSDSADSDEQPADA